MAIAKNVGVKAGKLVGWTGATLWKGTVMLADAAGDAGTGFVEGAEEGWDKRCAEMDAKRAERLAALRARKAEAAAAALAPQVETVMAAPKAKPAKAAA